MSTLEVCKELSKIGHRNKKGNLFWVTLDIDNRLRLPPCHYTVFIKFNNLKLVYTN